MEFETRAIHDGQEPDPATGSIITPIYQTATFVQDAVGVNKGYDYARVANPTRTALQVALASLENAEHGIAFSSGLGATTTLMHLVNPGERVVLIADVYGGVYRMTSQVYEPKGYLFDYVPAPDFANLADRLDDEHADGVDRDAVEPDAESGRHPLRRRRRACGRRDPRRRQHLRHAVSPESARPRRRRRLALDDRSTSAATPTSSAASAPRTTRRSPSASTSCRSRSARCPARSTAGSCCAGSRRSPCACSSHCENARAIAAWLDEQPGIEQVLYPGLPSHPGHEIAKRQMRDFGGMISVPRRVGGGGCRARRTHEALPARRVARRRREPDRAPGADDARVDCRRPVCGAAQPHPPLGRASRRSTT